MTPDAQIWLFAFIKSLFMSEPSKLWIERLRQAEALGSVNALGLTYTLEDLDPAQYTLIQEDYTQLFIGPQKHISLNESIYTEETPQFWGDAAVSLNRLMNELGLSLDANFKLMPDHITVEFEILQKLAEKEKEAGEAQDKETVKKCQNYFREFFLEHIALWVPTVCDQIIKKAETPFYQKFAQFLKQFIVDQKEDLSKFNV